MNARSLFSGAGGLDLGLERAGLRVISQCEKDPWRRRVLASHWPDTPCAHDVHEVTASGREQPVTRVMEGERNGTDPRRGRSRPANGDAGGLLCGGFPCQDLSVAGRRAGLNGDRSGLFFEFARIADELQPRWLLVENVPGLLSSADGRDFALVLSTLVDLGYGVAWRTLDARYFGVPQRRRRVFIVGHLGGDPEPALRALGQGGSGDLEAGLCSWQGTPRRIGGGADVVSPLRNPGDGGTGLNAEAAAGGQLVVSGPQAPNGRVDAEGAAGGHLIASSAVRRLTPVECERLMSWPTTLTLEGGSDDDICRAIESCRAEAGAAGSPDGSLRDVWQYGQAATSPSGHLESPGRRDRALRTVPRSAAPTASATSELHRVRFYLPTEAAQTFAHLFPGVPEGMQSSFGPPALGCSAQLTGWTAVDGPQTPDSRRYAACGDGVVSNVAEWIGRRMLAADR